MKSQTMAEARQCVLNIVAQEELPRIGEMLGSGPMNLDVAVLVEADLRELPFEGFSQGLGMWGLDSRLECKASGLH